MNLQFLEESLMSSYKRIFVGLIALIAFGLSFSVQAQQERDMIEVLRQQVKNDRQAVVAANMNLSEKQSEAFWPLYKEYHAEREPLVDTRVNLLTEFRDNYMGMTADQATQILQDALKFEADIVSLKQKYRSKFLKVLAPRATLRYYQIENKIDTVIDMELASVVPLRQ
jgi:hypothetical protein